MRVVIIIEPWSLASLVTNLNVQECSSVASAYKVGCHWPIDILVHVLTKKKTCVVFAIQQLAALSNVYLYLDGANSGWLGLPANLAPAAVLFSQIYKASGSPAQLRGLATNVGTYYPFTASSISGSASELQYITVSDFVFAYSRRCQFFGNRA